VKTDESCTIKEQNVSKNGIHLLRVNSSDESPNIEAISTLSFDKIEASIVDMFLEKDKLYVYGQVAPLDKIGSLQIPQEDGKDASLTV
jgi:hypothetical protein